MCLYDCAYNRGASWEWDKAKAKLNLQKHGIDFAEAVIALEDERALTMEDPDHSEQRFLTLGMDATGRILVVVYTYRGNKIRLISARKANRQERRRYEAS